MVAAPPRRRGLDRVAHPRDPTRSPAALPAAARRGRERLMDAQITLMRSATPLLSKRIDLADDGRPLADGSACQMQNGTATTTPAPDAATLAWKIENLSPAEAIVLGSVTTAA